MLIQTEVGRAEVVAKQLAALPGVLSSEYVTGPYDVVVRIGADNLPDLQANVVSGRAAGHGHHPHPDLPDRQRGRAPRSLGGGCRDRPTGPRGRC